MFIGGLLKVIAHRPGWLRSMLNCDRPGMAHFLLIGGSLKVTYMWCPRRPPTQAGSEQAAEVYVYCARVYERGTLV
jgi:hypothetical protein